MRTCTDCDAWVPEAAQACPCCEAPARRSWLTRASGALRALGGGAVAVTLMACYGAPPYQDYRVAPSEQTEPDVTPEEQPNEEAREEQEDDATAR